MIENIKHEVTELKESTPVNIKVTDYEEKTEYVVQFETKTVEKVEQTPEQVKAGEPEKTHEVTVTEEVSVVHDKVKHTNDIIAVEVLPEPVKPAEPIEPLEKGKEKPVETVEPVVVQPAIPEEKFVVVEEKSPEVTQQLHEAIKQITEEVRTTEHIPQKFLEVKETLIREHSEETKVEKIQQLIENTKTEEQILVTAVVNTETNKVVIEDIKPVQ